MKHLSALLILALLAPQSAMAADKLRGEVFCFPAKDVSKIVNSLKEVKESHRDVVDVNLNPKFIIKDGGVWPEEFYLQTEDAKIDIPVEKPSGLTSTFLEEAFAYPDSDVCVRDKTRADRPETDEGLYFEMGLSPFFHNRSGRHDIDELIEGAKDGKSFYKKMIPSVARMFMPDTDYLAVKYDDRRMTGAEIFALVGDEEVPLTGELYKEMFVISCDELEDIDATALIIKGGAYHLQPTVSVKTMKRFGFGQDVEDET